MKKFTIPNIISLLRILISPVFFYYIIKEDDGAILLACIFYTIGAITDYFDGWLARKYHEETTLGKFIDPLADKFLTTAAFVAFYVMDIIPLWMVVIIIFRDMLTTFMRLYADSIEKSIKTSWPAKVKTFIQMVFIAIILALILFKSLNIISADFANSIIWSDIIYVSMLILTLLTVWTAVEYLIQNRPVLSRFKKDLAAKFSK